MQRGGPTLCKTRGGVTKVVHKNIEIIWTTSGSECVIGGEQLISENGNSEYQGMNSQQ